MSISDTLLIIPAYNACNTIGEVIAEVRRHVHSADILVIDDGSTDNTAQIAKDAGVTVLSHGRNRGKGAGLKNGFKVASKKGYGAVLTIDSDLQHDPDCIPGFLKLGATGRYDIIIGVRQRSDNMPRLRVFANFTSSVIISLFACTQIRDSQSGYRWMRTDILIGFQLQGDKYDLESELLLKAGRAGLSVGELEIPTIYGDQESFINPFIDGIRFLKILIQSLFW